MAVLILILGLSVLIFYVPSLRISKVHIEGLSISYEKELRGGILEILSQKRWLIFPKDSVFLFPRGELENILKNFHRIKKFQLEVEFPAALRLSVEERKTWAVWCQSELKRLCLLVDEEGFAFVSSPALSGKAVLKIIDERNEDFLGKNVLPPEGFSKIRTFIGLLPRRTGEEIESVNIKISGNIINLVLKSGWFLIIDDETDPAKALENLSLALNSKIKESREKLEYIDLRFEDKIFYRFK